MFCPTDRYLFIDFIRGFHSFVLVYFARDLAGERCALGCDQGKGLKSWLPNYARKWERRLGGKSQMGTDVHMLLFIKGSRPG